MSKFIKRNTVISLEFDGDVYSVDMASDETAIRVGSALVKLEKIRVDAEKETEETEEQVKKLFEEMKEQYESAINDILGDQTASSKIFAGNDSLSFHDEVFAFIKSEFDRMGQEKIEKYSPNRAQRRA